LAEPLGETPRVADSCSREGLDDGLGEGLCGFCPVTKLPETTTCDVHGSPLLYLPPLPVRPCSFDPEKGFTASVWPTWSSSTCVDGVTLHAIDAKPKDAGAHVAKARHVEAGDERRAVGLVALDAVRKSNVRVSKPKTPRARTPLSPCVEAARIVNNTSRPA
jgi:hypothetical protein